MNHIVAYAQQLSLESLRNNQVSVSYLLEKFNISTFYCTQAELASKSYNRNFILLPFGLPYPEEKCMMVHEIAHLLMHDGNGLRAKSAMDCIVRSKHEYAASLFTAFYLIPDVLLRDKLSRSVPLWYLADCFDVTYDVMEFRIAKQQDYSVIVQDDPIERLAQYV
jgi:Zn-dependent peptidase ImmA (M78 family)